MNKSVLSIGIVLSLGTMGCAGVGLHHASSLIPQFQRERGLDSLWVSTERAPTQALDIPLYAEETSETCGTARRRHPPPPVKRRSTKAARLAISGIAAR